MRLEEYLEGFEPDESARRRRLAEEKSYEIIDYVEELQQELETSLQGDSMVGSTAPSVFVGRSSYPNVNAGIMAPVGQESAAEEFATSGEWYRRGLDIQKVLQYRTGLLNSRRAEKVDVRDVWDGFVGTQREVAIADRPVDVEIGLRDRPEIDLDSYRQPQANAPSGPIASAERAELGENPHVPTQVEKTLEDDDWRAEGAMTYLYRRGFDVYDINQILSVGALGRGESRRLVPTRWSITAVDDTISRYLRGRIRNAPSIDQVQVFANQYIGNRYWIVMAPGHWEFELVEMKAPGSIWNPEPNGTVYMSSASEGFEGRTGYVEETAGAYYAARLGVLEYLESIGRQAKVLVLREVSDDYWAPVGVWQVRESVRNAFEEGPTPELAGEPGVTETFGSAIEKLLPQLPVSRERLRRKSDLVEARQAGLADFG